MDRSNRIRWRHRRNTIPARRHRRRRHRRKRKCGNTYYPMRVDPDSALRGVRSRLVGAVVAAAVTLVSFLYAMLSSLSTFGSTFALTMGVCSFGAAVALLLSARHEEQVHELASSFDQLADPDELEEPTATRALPEPDPLEGFSFEEAFAERAKNIGASRSDYSEQTDGVI